MIDKKYAEQWSHWEPYAYTISLIIVMVRDLKKIVILIDYNSNHNEWNFRIELMACSKF